MPVIKIQCPAKINLTLKVTGKRPDGFHNIESIMQTISLYDYLTISMELSSDMEIILSGSNPEIPYNEKNLVYKAAMLFFNTLGTTNNYRVNIFIEKNIPVAAGLAGGSTDAAGTLFGLNKLLNEVFSLSELHSICAQLGSDLNFCLAGGTQMTSGRGEILTPITFEEKMVSLIKPLNLGISAREAYSKFSEKLSRNISGREDFVNDLEWAVIDDYSELKTIKSLYPSSIMSGSGSTYYLIGDTFKSIPGFWIANNLTTVNHGVKPV